MNSKKTIKRAMLSSVFALFACFTMLIGTTFAWFTDSVASGSNVIKSGNLDIKVEYTLDGENWADLDGANNLFQKGLWEPGHTEVVALKVSNVGTLALKYNASMNIINEVIGKTKDGADIKLSDHLLVDAFSQQANNFGDILLDMVFDSRDAGTWNLESFAASNLLIEDTLLEQGEAKYVFVMVQMPETVGNEANHDGVNLPSIEFGIDVIATQHPHEDDSFSNDYDADAWTDAAAPVTPDANGVVEVWTAQQLSDVMHDLDGVKTVEIMDDVDLGSRLWAPARATGSALTINGNGHTISNMRVEGEGYLGFIGANYKSLTINDLTFEGAEIESDYSFVGVVIGYCYGNNVLNNVDVIDCSVVSDISVKAIRTGGIIGFVPNDGGALTLNGCDVEGSHIEAYHSVGALVGSLMTGKTVTVENCTSKNNTLVSAGNQVGAFAFASGSNGYAEYVPASGFTAENNTILNVVESAEKLADVVAAGATNIYLLDGEYNVANCGGKTLTISGSENAVIKIMNEGEDGCDYGFDGSNVTFNGITINTTANTGNYKGFARMTATYNGCNFIGAYTSYQVQTFNECTFDFDGYFWVWGATAVTFDSCEFVGDSRAILAHGSANTIITIRDCAFNASEKGYTYGGDNTAVVEIDPTGTNVYTINFEGTNTKTEHYAGWTRVKDGSTGHIITGLN